MQTDMPIDSHGGRGETEVSKDSEKLYSFEAIIMVHLEKHS